ncbi:MAG TPA: ribonuclease activity regulator RraA [Acetobacteraceae bacterium]|nr:ribonuclease activity regulator RraA [Acetobacteraceae bacterium]
MIPLPSSASVTTQLLKKHGLRNTAVRGVHALDPGNCRFVGRAVTLRYLPLREDMADAQSLSNPQALMHRVMERVKPGDALVIDAMGTIDSGILGEMLVTRLHVLGVAGIVCDGAMRDLSEIRNQGMPMLLKGGAPPPSFVNLMLVDLDIPIACGGVTVCPGDSVVADEDGVAICPACFSGTVLPDAVEQDRVERYIRQRVAAGEGLVGLYPMNETVVAAYRDWAAAGEPAIRRG